VASRDRPRKGCEMSNLRLAIAVPERPAVLQSDAVHHPVSEEPMPRIAVLRIRTVAEVEAVELGRDGAFDLESELRALGVDRTVVELHPPRRVRVELP